MPTWRLLVLALVLGFAGCGGDEEEKRVTIGPPAAGAKACKEAQIGLEGSGGGEEGVCTQDGQTLVVADRGHVVDLGELRVELVGHEVTDEIKREGSTASPIEDSDTWVIVEVEVENRSQHIGKPGQGWLIRNGGELYSINELVDGEGVFESESSLAPGKSATGKLVFEMPKTAAAQLEEDASLIAYRFSDGRKLEEDFLHKPKVAGVIRLYE